MDSTHNTLDKHYFMYVSTKRTTHPAGQATYALTSEELLFLHLNYLG